VITPEMFWETMEEINLKCEKEISKFVEKEWEVMTVRLLHSE